MKQWGLDTHGKKTSAENARADSCSPLHSAAAPVPTVWQT
jgi:hypothetical protein